LLNSTAVHKEIVKYLAGDISRTKNFIDMWDASHIHFSRYRNLREAFHRRNDEQADWFSHCLDLPDAFATCLVARLRPANGQSHEVLGVSPCTIRAVDYDISPYRTTGHAVFEDGSDSNCGTGGIDLIAQDCNTGHPIICEIKSPGDSNSFLALVQALTYTLEITTLHQADRLSKYYVQFKNVPRGPYGCRSDVFMIYRKGDRPRLLQDSMKFAKSLMCFDDRRFGQTVRRIAFVEADCSASAGITLECAFEARPLPEHK
jgi:hypothetical protein